MGEGSDGMGEAAPVGREVGSTWLVVSGPPGSKVVEVFDGGESDAHEYAYARTARGVEAEVREMVTLAYSVGLRVDVGREGVGDGALLSTLLARALLRAADGVLDDALAAPPPLREEPKIVVPRLAVVGKGRGS